MNDRQPTTAPLPPFWTAFRHMLDALRAVAGLAAPTVLVAQYAFQPPVDPVNFHRASVLVAAAMIFDMIARVGLLSDARTYITRCAYAVAGAAVATLACMVLTAEEGAIPAPLPESHFVLGAQAYMAATAVLYAVDVAAQGTRAVLTVLAALTALGGAALLLLAHGFSQPIVAPWKVQLLGGAVAVAFAADRIIRARRGAAEERRAFVRRNWIDFAVVLAAAALAAARTELVGAALSAVAIYVVLTHTYSGVSVAMASVGRRLTGGAGLHPALALAGLFAALAVGGSVALSVPAAFTADRAATPGHDPMPYIDSLATAVAASCSTALTVKDVGGDFTPFGQTVILAMIQLGGLGLLLIGAAAASRLLGPDDRDELGAAPGESSRRLKSLAGFVVATSLAIELVGAILLYPMFADVPGRDGQPLTAAQAAWYSVFHSVSAYCNAGLSLYGSNLMAGMREGWDTPLREHWQVLGVLAPLVVLGSLGTWVLRDAVAYMRDAVRWLLGRGSARPRMRAHSQLVLSSTLLLLVAGASVLILLEARAQAPERQFERHAIGAQGAGGDWQRLDRSGRIQVAVFESVSARSGGFSTFDCGELSSPAKLWMSCLMLVGGSPGGAAGGMKITALAVLVLTVGATLRRRNTVDVYGLSMAPTAVNRLVSVAALYALFVLAATFALSLAMPNYPLVDVFFESCSACGNVGLSTGLTRQLDESGKYVLMAAMMVGRVAPLALLLWLCGSAGPGAGVTQVRRGGQALPAKSPAIRGPKGEAGRP